MHNFFHQNHRHDVFYRVWLPKLYINTYYIFYIINKNIVNIFWPQAPFIDFNINSTYIIGPIIMTDFPLKKQSNIPSRSNKAGVRPCTYKTCGHHVIWWCKHYGKPCPHLHSNITRVYIISLNSHYASAKDRIRNIYFPVQPKAIRSLSVKYTRNIKPAMSNSRMTETARPRRNAICFNMMWDGHPKPF